MNMSSGPNERTEATPETEIREPTQKEIEEACAAFESRVTEIRATLKKAGHLELVADGRFSIEKKELIGKIGMHRANRFLNDFFHGKN